MGLDPRLRFRLWSQFRAWADAGTTLVVSTHVMDEAAHVDRLAFLSEGQVVADGSPADLKEAVLRLSGGPESPDGGAA